ncbi:hypothetical protein EGT36_11590 [Agrobacterium sp. FDAARGOS_525]|nr:hypothetical protein EGT36_11590 [Agrobacterium sp. FDAARGOS_525]
MTISRYLESNAAYFGKDWPRRTQVHISEVFTALGNLPDRPYPQFHRKIMPTPNAPPQVGISLGDLDLQKLRGVPAAKRDEAALQLLRDDALLVFQKWESVFKIGQTILRDEQTPRAIGKSWSLVRNLLFSLKREIDCGAAPTHRHPHHGLHFPAVWREAGFPVVTNDRAFTTKELYQHAYGCLGASVPCTIAVKILFCIATGWNKEQIDLLPAEPYAFRTGSKSAMGDQAFLAAFKNRADHYVAAHLERGFRRFDLDQDKLDFLWEAQISDEQTSESANSCVIEDNTTLAIFDRYQELVAPLRRFDLGRIQDRFFLAISQSGITSAEGDIAGYKLGESLSTKGIGYQTIRQSYINSKRRSLRSVSLASYASNHSSSRTILTHYDDKVQQQELNEAQAFWQNCIQAELVAKSPELAVKFRVPAGDLEWFSYMSVVSGISASLTIARKSQTVTDTEYLTFEPSLERLIEIYCIKLSLIKSRKFIGPQRWQVQGVPLLASIKAIRKHAFDSGFGDVYREGVRQTRCKLKSGAILLPRILDIFR